MKCKGVCNVSFILLPLKISSSLILTFSLIRSIGSFYLLHLTPAWKSWHSHVSVIGYLHAVSFKLPLHSFSVQTDGFKTITSLVDLSTATDKARIAFLYPACWHAKSAYWITQLSTHTLPHDNPLNTSTIASLVGSPISRIESVLSNHQRKRFQ